MELYSLRMEEINRDLSITDNFMKALSMETSQINRLWPELHPFISMLEILYESGYTNFMDTVENDYKTCSNYWWYINFIKQFRQTDPYTNVFILGRIDDELKKEFFNKRREYFKTITEDGECDEELRKEVRSLKRTIEINEFNSRKSINSRLAGIMHSMNNLDGSLYDFMSEFMAMWFNEEPKIFAKRDDVVIDYIETMKKVNHDDIYNMLLTAKKTIQDWGKISSSNKNWTIGYLWNLVTEGFSENNKRMTNLHKGIAIREFGIYLPHELRVYKTIKRRTITEPMYELPELDRVGEKSSMSDKASVLFNSSATWFDASMFAKEIDGDSGELINDSVLNYVINHGISDEIVNKVINWMRKKDDYIYHKKHVLDCTNVFNAIHYMFLHYGKEYIPNDDEYEDFESNCRYQIGPYELRVYHGQGSFSRLLKNNKVIYQTL